MPLQIRRGTNTQRTAMTQPLAQGELLYVTDDQRIYIGNGTTLGGIQITGYTNEDAQDAAAQLFANGTHTGITFTYNDAGASVSALVDLLNNTGTIGGVFKGNVVAEDSTLMIDAASGQIVGPVFGNVTGNVTGNADTATVASTVAIIATNSTAANHFITFVDTATGNENLRTDTSLTYDPSTNTFTASTFQGSLLGNSAGFHDGDVQGSVFGDDSTKLVDAVENKFFGDLSGEIITEIIRVPDASFGLNIQSKKDASFDVVYHKGTQDARLPMTAGEPVGSICIKGYDGSAYQFAGAIYAEWEAGAVITDLAPLSTITLASGKGGIDNQLASLDSKGIWLSPISKTTVYAVAGTALPSAVTMGAGARAFVSDATVSTFATAYAGGGSIKVPVYSDGTVWLIG